MKHFIYCDFRKHIITATYIDMFAGVENTPLYPRNIPDAPTFQANARGSAVNNSDHVVIYENTGMYGYFMGARSWWMFKVCISRMEEEEDTLLVKGEVSREFGVI